MACYILKLFYAQINSKLFSSVGPIYDNGLVPTMTVAITDKVGKQCYPPIAGPPDLIKHRYEANSALAARRGIVKVYLMFYLPNF